MQKNMLFVVLVVSQFMYQKYMMQTLIVSRLRIEEPLD